MVDKVNYVQDYGCARTRALVLKESELYSPVSNKQAGSWQAVEDLAKLHMENPSRAAHIGNILGRRDADTLDRRHDIMDSITIANYDVTHATASKLKEVDKKLNAICDKLDIKFDTYA